MWFIGVIVVLVGVAMIVVSFKSKDIETPDYKVVRSLGDVEIQYISLDLLVGRLNTYLQSRILNLGRDIKHLMHYVALS